MLDTCPNVSHVSHCYQFMANPWDSEKLLEKKTPGLSKPSIRVALALMSEAATTMSGNLDQLGDLLTVQVPHRRVGCPGDEGQVDVLYVGLSICSRESNLISSFLGSFLQPGHRLPRGLLELVCWLFVIPSQVPGVDLQLVLLPQVIPLQGISVLIDRIALLEFHDELEEPLLSAGLLLA